MKDVVHKFGIAKSIASLLWKRFNEITTGTRHFIYDQLAKNYFIERYTQVTFKRKFLGTLSKCHYRYRRTSALEYNVRW